MATSFARHVAPILAPYRDNMLWRFDLADYDAVKANARIIAAHIDPSQGDMPPPPLPPLDQVDIDVFNAWITEGFPP
jgi:hypothetical protein